MADPLSVAASIVGLMSAAASIGKVLGPYISAARDTPQIAHHVHTEVQTASIILSALQSLTQNMTSTSIQRAALVEVDQVIAVLTSGVLVFSDLEASVGTLPLPDPSSITRLALRSRFQWARKEAEFTSLLSRLQSFKSSISLILDILQSDSSLRAEKHQVELTESVAQLLQSTQGLSHRLMNLEDSFDAHTLVNNRRSVVGSVTSPTHSEPHLLPDGDALSSTPHSPASSNTLLVSGFEFEDDLQTSRPYRRAQRDTMDFSFRSSIAQSHAWSVFSGLSLGDISVMSVIALPVYPDEITNSHHYKFGGKPSDAQAPAKPVASTLSNTSLLRKCIKVELTLCQLPGFEGFSKLCSVSDHSFSAIQRHFEEGSPLFSLCRLFPQFDVDGIYNSHYHWDNGNTAKGQTYWALRAISESSLFKPDEIPTVSQVVGGRPAGFLKAVDMIEKILALENNTISIADFNAVNDTIQARSGESQDSVEFLIVDDFTKRSWKLVQQIARLNEDEVDFKRELSGTTDWQAIFMPILAMLEPELQFLLGVEANILQPSGKRRWAPIFEKWEAFIEPYGHLIGSQPRNSRLLKARASQNKAIMGAWEYIVLPHRLVEMKSQFLTTLKTIIAGSRGFDDVQKLDLILAEQAVERCRSTISLLIKEEELLDVKTDLLARVAGWKDSSSKTQFLGKLLLFDQEVMIPTSTGRERHYRIYLFETILIICIEVQPQTPSRARLFPRGKPLQPTREVELIPKGKILIRDVSCVLPHFSHAEKSIRIFWKNDSEDKAFEVHFKTKAQQETWATVLEERRIQFSRSQEEQQIGTDAIAIAL